MLTVLQPTLASLGGPVKGDATKHFDKARLYFSLLMYSPEGLQKAASDKPGRFTVAEYTALMQVSTCLSQVNISTIAKSISNLSVSQGMSPKGEHQSVPRCSMSVSLLWGYFSELALCLRHIYAGDRTYSMYMLNVHCKPCN